ncbi:MAG: M20/M25/M40 family metallo-hydrolase [bacterium]
MEQSRINKDALVKQFFNLACIDGISRDERAVADFILDHLNSMNISAKEDDTADKIGGNTGNIIVRFPGKSSNNQNPLLLMAHMDTVDHTSELKPVIEQGIIKSGGETILGADDRAGVAIILHVLEYLHKNNIDHRPLEVVFSVGEEKGMLGSSHLNFSQLKSQKGYILDCSRPPGQYVACTPSSFDVNFKFLGKASHAGVAIEDGINAVSMALEVLQTFPIGRIDAETTANIGTINGGTAVNVVPEKVSATGEIRSFKPETINSICSKLEKQGQTIADKYGGKVDIQCIPIFEGFNLSEDIPVVTRLISAYKKLSLKPEGLTYYGGSDANIVNKHNINTVNIGVGIKNPHSHNEEIAVKDLVTSAEIVLDLVGE